MSARRGIIITIGVIFLIGLVSIFGIHSWFIARQDKVADGLARSSFPYADYTPAELDKMFPQYANANVKTTQTPEQTHQKFLAALKKGDLDKAVECCFREGDQPKMKIALKDIKEKGYLEEMIGDLSGGIKPDVVGSAKASYYYSINDGGKKYKEYLTFIKDNRGVWLIEAL